MVHMQAYLRLAKMNVAAEECVSASNSPSSMPALPAALLNMSPEVQHVLVGPPDMHACAGQLPALEHGIDIVEGAGHENASAEAIIAYLQQHGHDLDSGLSAAQVKSRSVSLHDFTASAHSCLLARS